MRLGLIWAPVCGAIVALGAAPAAGGPWTRGEGSGQVIRQEAVLPLQPPGQAEQNLGENDPAIAPRPH